MKQNNEKEFVAGISVFSNFTLVILKLVCGFLMGSVSVISEAAHSAVDLLAAIIAYFAVLTSSKPPDKEHPHGHGKFENISGTVEALLIFLAAAWIINEAVKKLIHPRALEDMGWGVAVMALSSCANWLVSGLLFKTAKKTDSIALEADAWHLRTDVYTSLGVTLGLALMWLGKKFLPAVNVFWIDPVAAIFVALLIIRAAYELTLRSSRDLLDAGLPESEESEIKKYITDLIPLVVNYHNLRTRKSGPYRFVDVHLMVDENMTVKDSHDITARLAEKIQERFPDTRVMIHVEPCDGLCGRACLAGCLIGGRNKR